MSITTKKIDFKKGIETELARARKKFPEWPVDPIHAAAIIAEEAGELVRAANQFVYEGGTYLEMYEEAVQVGAMATRFIESIHSYQETPSKQRNDSD